MIPLILFYFHIMALVYFFAKEYQQHGMSAGVLLVVFFIIIFSVGWTLASFILKYLISENGFGLHFERDVLSLILLTLVEGIVYAVYYRGSDRKKAITAK